MHGESGHADLGKYPVKRLGGSRDQLDLRHHGRISDDVYITLCKRAESPLLRPVRTEDISDLKCLERTRKILFMVCVIPAQRNRQIIPQRTVRKLCTCFFRRNSFFLLYLLKALLKLTPSLLYLEDQLFILPAVLSGQVLDMLHRRSPDLGKSVSSVCVTDQAEHMLSQGHILRKKILHALHWCLYK